MNITSGTAALEAVELGKRYRRGWALQDCTFALPPGRVAALVGPNGAGKSTLMALSTGLLRPTTGIVRVLGREPRGSAHHKLAFLGQDKPLYKTFTVDEILRAGRALNPTWDHKYAQRLVREAGVNSNAKVGTLSGGQRTRVALAVALGRRPELLMLDEPLADLDPLAREEVMHAVMAEVVANGMTVVLSSHMLADLEGVCDHLVLLAGGRVHLAGDVDRLVAGHRLLTRPRTDGGRGLSQHAVVETRVAGNQDIVLVTAGGGVDTSGWQARPPTLEELAMAYLRSASPGHPARRAEVAVA